MTLLIFTLFNIFNISVYWNNFSHKTTCFSFNHWNDLFVYISYSAFLCLFLLMLCAGNKVTESRAVSYTHLDVYKRQHTHTHVHTYTYKHISEHGVPYFVFTFVKTTILTTWYYVNVFVLPKYLHTIKACLLYTSRCV